MKKRIMVDMCNLYGITIPEGATNKQIETLIYSFFENAAVVKTNDGFCFELTDKDTEDYIVEFTISGYYSVRAESEEVARGWAEDNVSWDFRSNDCVYAEITGWEIEDSYKEN